MALPIVTPDWVHLEKIEEVEPSVLRILVAEDDSEMRWLLCDSLLETRRAILAYSDGLHLLDGLERARAAAAPPALVVTDLRMPGPSGFDIVRTMRSWGWTVPVILISAFADASVVEQAEGLGIHTVFSKPFELDELRTVVRELLDPHG
jgi:CheY-like chemotaxis protein